MPLMRHLHTVVQINYTHIRLLWVVCMFITCKEGQGGCLNLKDLYYVYQYSYEELTSLWRVNPIWIATLLPAD